MTRTARRIIYKLFQRADQIGEIGRRLVSGGLLARLACARLVDELCQKVEWIVARFGRRFFRTFTVDGAIRWCCFVVVRSLSVLGGPALFVFLGRALGKRLFVTVVVAVVVVVAVLSGIGIGSSR